MLTIEADAAGQRVDNFLLRELRAIPKSVIYRILRQGQVRVNSGRIGPDYRLHTGDLLRIPPVYTKPDTPKTKIPAHVLDKLPTIILHEDEDFLVFDKPSGMAVHGGTGIDYGIINALRVLRPHSTFLELAHRLDRETSGCLLLAKNRSALLHVHQLLRHGGIDKRYLTLLSGHWRGGVRDVDYPLEQNTRRGGERHTTIDTEGKRASTRFTPVTKYADACFVEARLDTGRTHQIRAHAAAIGHPVAGDQKYGAKSFNQRMRTLGLKRLFLHAHTLALPALCGTRKIHVKAPLSDDLQRILTRLEKSSAA